MADLSGMFERIAELETRGDRVEVELAVVRGPLPLAHKQPVDAGALGDVVQAVSSVRKLVRNAAVALGIAILSGAGGTLVAIRAHWVEQGRALEKKNAEIQYLREVERRLRLLERRSVANTGTPVVGQPDETAPVPYDDRDVLLGTGWRGGVPDYRPSDQ